VNLTEAEVWKTRAFTSPTWRVQAMWCLQHWWIWVIL
jgi:hypothetical protein